LKSNPPFSGGPLTVPEPQRMMATTERVPALAKDISPENLKGTPRIKEGHLKAFYARKWLYRSLATPGACKNSIFESFLKWLLHLQSRSRRLPRSSHYGL
jgi:hypothetical protein